jgi:hypothetical protein
LGLGVTFSSAVFGQAMVEYGHGVAKAGVAGAASGTGLVGIFSKMKDTSDDKDKKKHYGTVKTQPTTANQDLRRAPGEPANAPLKMRTSSGVVISGVSPSWMSAAYSDPVRDDLSVKSVEWSNPSEEQAAAAEAGSPETGLREQAAAPGDTGSAAVESSQTGEAVSPGKIVSNTSGYGLAGPQAAADVSHPEPVTDAEATGVRIGSKIDDVIRTLGRPTFSFTGIVGKNYTEKYVFKKADGETITVLTWAGIVTSVLVT